MELKVLVTCFSLFGFWQDAFCMHTVSQEFVTTSQQDLSEKLNKGVSPKMDKKRVLFTFPPVSAINHHNRHSKEMPHVALRVLKPQHKTNERHPVLIHPIKALENTSSLRTQSAEYVDSMNNNKMGDNLKIKEDELKSTASKDAKNIPESHESQNNYKLGNKNCDVHDMNGAKNEKTHQGNNDRKMNKEGSADPKKSSSFENFSSVSQEIKTDKKNLNISRSEGKANFNKISTEVEDRLNNLKVVAPILGSLKINKDDLKKPKLNEILTLTANTLKSGEDEDMQEPSEKQIQKLNDIVNTGHDNAIHHRGRNYPLTKFNSQQTPHHAPERHLNSMDLSFVNIGGSSDEDCRYIPVFDWPTRWFDSKTGTYYPIYPKVAVDGGTQDSQHTQQLAVKLNNGRENMDLVNRTAFSNVILPLTHQMDTQNVLTPPSFEPDVQSLDEPVYSNEMPLAYDPNTENVITPMSFRHDVQKDSTLPSFQPEIQDLNQSASPNIVLPLADQPNSQNDLMPPSFELWNRDSDQSPSPNMIQPSTRFQDLKHPASPNLVLPLANQPQIQNVFEPASLEHKIQDSDQAAWPNVIQSLTYQPDIQNLNQPASPNVILPSEYKSEIENILAPASFKHEVQDFNQTACPNKILSLGYQPAIQNLFAPSSLKLDIEDMNQPACPNQILPLARQPDTPNAVNPLAYHPDASNVLPSTYQVDYLTSYKPDLSKAPPPYKYPFENELSELHLSDVYNKNPNLQNSLINGKNPLCNIVYNPPRSYNAQNMVYQTKYYSLPNLYNQYAAIPAYSVEENFQKRPYYIENYRTPYVIGSNRYQNNDDYNQQ